MVDSLVDLLIWNKFSALYTFPGWGRAHSSEPLEMETELLEMATRLLAKANPVTWTGS